MFILTIIFSLSYNILYTDDFDDFDNKPKAKPVKNLSMTCTRPGKAAEAYFEYQPGNTLMWFQMLLNGNIAYYRDYKILRKDEKNKRFVFLGQDDVKQMVDFNKKKYYESMDSGYIECR